MATSSLEKALLRRLIWAQNFAARLLELGAPATSEALFELGKDRYDSSPERDAVRAAESVWSEWQTES